MEQRQANMHVLLINLSPSQECTDPLSQGVLTEDLIGLCMFVKLGRSLINDL